MDGWMSGGREGGIERGLYVRGNDGARENGHVNASRDGLLAKRKRFTWNETIDHACKLT